MRTPVIDKLVQAGVDLDCHYVMPMCTPTRVALLTGSYPSRFGNHCMQAANSLALPFGTPTLASLLQKARYDTALIGKWLAVRNGNWKIVRYRDQPWQLFDLVPDQAKLDQGF